ncbi:MAG: zinc-dependent metalloprotease [Bacteriovoracaceae bacterium]
MKKIKSSVLTVCALSALAAGCINQPASKKSNSVSNQSKYVDEKIGEGQVELQVISNATLKEKILKKQIVPLKHVDMQKLLVSKKMQTKGLEKSLTSEASAPATLDESENSLLVGFPIDLLGQQNIFGGVITKVSDKEDESLGMLKLTDLSPIHVRPQVIQSPSGQYVMSLIGCTNECEESSDQIPLISIPIVGVNVESRMIVLDIDSIGNKLDLVTMLDPTGAYTKLRAVSSATTNVEYSFETLVFDVLTKFVPVTAESTDSTAQTTEISVRWYLKLNSASNPSFIARDATPGVGYFTTSRSSTPKITRFSTTDYGQTIKYYIKNVPAEWQDVFTGAIDNWNKEFRGIVGRDMLSYEIINSDDPNADKIVAGDIRHNVIEWDVNNKAPYGGLGPSIANQFTGETMAAHVLIQGPKIIELYTEWYKISEEVRNLKAVGETRKADLLVANFNRKAKSSINELQQTKFSVSLGEKLQFNVRSQMAALEDPIVKGSFEVVPEGISYKEYMTGYFTEMLEHELGHNLGLRHNFKGNLGAYEVKEKGSVSRSIMEYLGRGYRYLNAIGQYDRMAISYGYRGITPKHLNWFCTDEDQGDDADSIKVKSPECTKSDATSDPYSFWEERMKRSLNLLIAPSSTEAPAWKVEDMQSEINDYVLGLTAYALSAEQTADTWTNFFGKGNRPDNKDEVKDFVIATFQKQLCNPNLSQAIASKVSIDAQKVASDNLTALRQAVSKKASELGLEAAEAIECK